MDSQLIAVDGYVATRRDATNLRRDTWSFALDQPAFGPRRLVVAFADGSGRFRSLAHTRRTTPPELALGPCIQHVGRGATTAVAFCDETVAVGPPPPPDLPARFAMARSIAASHGVHLVDWFACDGHPDSQHPPRARTRVQVVGRSSPAATRFGSMTVEEVYLLALHEPYESAEHPVPINAIVVHATTLLHPEVPQPDGGLMYRCLTEFPRATEALVPLSTLTFELDGGGLWPAIADWTEVVDALVRLARRKGCDAIVLGLPELDLALLANGPSTAVTVYAPDGRRDYGPQERQEHLDALHRQVRSVLALGRLWPGDNLVPPPRSPRVMPYRPWPG